MLILLGGVTIRLHAQIDVKIISDVTSKVQNADFKADTPIEQNIHTYDYDMTDAGLGAGGTEIFGQQPVTGWTGANPSDNIQKYDRSDGANARASGVFSLTVPDADDGNIPGRLNGAYFAPRNNEATQALGIEGPVLGLVAVWGADVKYTQPITLPAGDYMLLITLQNTAGTSAFQSSYNGFVHESGTATFSTRMSFAVGEWATDTILFRLTEETAGMLSLGYKSANYGSARVPHIFIDHVKLYAIERNVLDQKEIDEARALLLEQINIGIYREVDTDDAQAVYDNSEATLEEVMAATEAQAERNEQAITDLSAFFIKNAHFSLDATIEDGICTYDYDMPDPKGANGRAVTHYGMQPVTGWVASTPSDNIQHMANDNDSSNDAGMNGRASGVFAIGGDEFLGGAAFLPPRAMSNGDTEGKLLGFLSVWAAMSQYTQRVSLPAGKYTLTFSYYNVGGANAIGKNLMGFVADDGREYLDRTVVFGAGKWLQTSIKFELYEATSGYFTMGYTAANQGSGKMPHLFIDGVSLNYVGTGINPSLMALSAAISTGEETIAKEFYPRLKTQLQEAVNKAKVLFDNVSNDDESNMAAANAISDLLSDVNANITAYEELNLFYESKLLGAIDKYDAENYPELNETLQNMCNGVANAKKNFSWTTAEIEEYIIASTSFIKSEVQKLFDAAVASGEQLKTDLDISILFDQMAYTYSTVTAINTSVPDTEWKYGDATNFKTLYGTAEVWNQSPFEVSRTLADMPVGKYTITTKAFYRTADNETNYLNYIEADSKAFVFAGNVKTPLANVVEVANRDGEELEGWKAVSNGEVYVPNSQKAAYNLFNDKQFENLQKSVTTALVDVSDLTFGIKTDQMEYGSWVVWYTFSLTYNALDVDAVDVELQGLIDEAKALRNGNVPIQIIRADEYLGNAISQGEKAHNGNSLNEKKVAVQALKDAIAYTAEGRSMLNELMVQFTFFSNLKEEYSYIDSSDETLDQLLEQMKDKFENNEAVNALLSWGPSRTAWTSYVLGQDMTGASESDPVDITGVLANANFNCGNSRFWWSMADDILEDGTRDRIGKNQGYKNNAVYINEQDGIELNQFFELWRPDGDILHNGIVGNTLITALPEGYYRLGVDAFSTNQKGTPEGGISGTYLIATDGTTSRTTPIATRSKTPEHFSVDFYTDGMSVYTVGLLVSGTNASWVAADNFTLKFMGTTNETFTLGDVNGDGSITAQDASLVQQLVAKKVSAATEGIVYEAADVNGDGEVTAQDASLIQQHVAKKIDLSTLNK